MKVIKNIENYAIEILKHMEQGNPIVVPTDTNYNLACIPDSVKAIDKVYSYKEREKDKPLSLFFLQREDWKRYGKVQNNRIMNILVKQYWPGPLNIVMSKLSNNFDYMLNDNNSIALGCIRNKTWRKFLKCIGKPAVALTSANISGTISDEIVTKEIALKQMGNRVSYMIESEDSMDATRSSSIIMIEKHGIQILRDGDISKEELSEVLTREGFYVH